MEISMLLVIVVNFVLIWALPVIFFRQDGKKNAMWTLTALPFVVAPAITTATYIGMLTPHLLVSEQATTILTSISCLLCLCSIFLIALTMGTHRIPVALWHQKPEDDQPACIVTWGSYKYIRHPFYTAFIIAMIANCLATLHLLSVVVLLFTGLQLNYTASREEHRLSNESNGFGEEYTKYMTLTGRFFPRLAL